LGKNLKFQILSSGQELSARTSPKCCPYMAKISTFSDKFLRANLPRGSKEKCSLALSAVPFETSIAPPLAWEQILAATLVVVPWEVYKERDVRAERA
jgi:hypothetical protein